MPRNGNFLPLKKRQVWHRSGPNRLGRLGVGLSGDYVVNCVLCLLQRLLLLDSGAILLRRLPSETAQTILNNLHEAIS